MASGASAAAICRDKKWEYKAAELFEIIKIKI
jgi:hypothetical protein